jgi:hypothetical protein
LIPRDRLTKSKIKLGIWIGCSNVPEFGFWFASQSASDFFGRVDL